MVVALIERYPHEQLDFKLVVNSCTKCVLKQRTILIKGSNKDIMNMKTGR